MAQRQISSSGALRGDCELSSPISGAGLSVDVLQEATGHEIQYSGRQFFFGDGLDFRIRELAVNAAGPLSNACLHPVVYQSILIAIPWPAMVSPSTNGRRGCHLHIPRRGRDCRTRIVGNLSSSWMMRRSGGVHGGFHSDQISSLNSPELPAALYLSSDVMSQTKSEVGSR